MNLDEQRLRLERQRLAVDTLLKRRDQQFQRYQFEVGRGGVAAWVRTPLGAAAVAAILGLFGSVWNGYESNKLEMIRQEANYKLERQRLEGNLILDAIRTSGTGAEKEKQAAANLLFLSEIGLITLPPTRLENFRHAAADALPVLPVRITPSPQPSNDTWNARLQEVEVLLANQQLAEAIAITQRILNSPDVPPDVAARSRQIQLKAKEELQRAFDGTVAGPTRNRVKPH